MASKILHLVEYLYQGGIEKLLEQFARYRLPHQELYFCAYEMNELKGMAEEIFKQGYPVFIYKKASGHDWRLQKKLFHLVKKYNIDVIHTHDFGPMAYAIFLKMRYPHIKLVHTQHTLHHFITNKKYVLFFQFAAFFYYKIVAVSKSVEQTLKRESLFFRRNNITTIYNGVDLKFLNHSSVLSPRSLNVKPYKEVRLVSISRISPEKNILHTLRACKMLSDNNVNFVFNHVGPGDNEEEKAIRLFIEQNNLQQKIILHGPQIDVRPFLHSNDIFISSSLTEGHPISVLEAMGAGKLCFCSNIPAHRELSSTGIVLFDLQNPVSLYQLIMDYLYGPSRYFMLAEQSRQEVEKRFDIRETILKYNSLYMGRGRGERL